MLESASSSHELDLSGRDLSNVELRRVDLEDADMQGANLNWADLSGAVLSGANLRAGQFTADQLAQANVLGGVVLPDRTRLSLDCWKAEFEEWRDKQRQHSRAE